MKLITICFVASLFLLSCQHATKKTLAVTKTKPDGIKHSINVQSVTDTLTIPEDTIPKIVIPDGTIQVGQNSVDTINKVEILEAGSIPYQGDVDPEKAKLNWQGLFCNKGNFYIKPTKIKITNEHSWMDDDENQKTGWRVKCDIKDSCFILISGVDNLVKGVVKRFPWSGDFYYAGQKKEFNYEGVNYTLYTTGSKRDGKACDLKLFLMANIKGHSYNQLIASIGGELAGDNPESIELTFIGDIDGDKIPDFITGIYGYGGGDTSVYLSKSAGDDAILKLVAVFTTTG